MEEITYFQCQVKLSLTNSILLRKIIRELKDIKIINL